MFSNLNQNYINETILYNNIVLLARNKSFYTKFSLSDTFQNRIHLIFLHASFLFIKIKLNKTNKSYKTFYQKMFDLIFIRIEQNMRELGYGDVSVNKNMKSLVKTFYNILLYCENYKKKSQESKKKFLLKYLELKNIEKDPINGILINYFDKYEAFCFNLSLDSVLSGVLNFNFK